MICDDGQHIHESLTLNQRMNIIKHSRVDEISNVANSMVQIHSSHQPTSQ